MNEVYPGQEPEKIAQWFFPARTPEGGAPDEIREQWVGVPLPVRESNATISEDRLVSGFLIGANVNRPGDIKVNDPEDMVSVDLSDAIKALEMAGREEAAYWWVNWSETKPPYFGNNLMFKADEGDLLTPAEAEKRMPGVSQFDNMHRPQIDI
jgi:hypothetical protein